MIGVGYKDGSGSRENNKEDVMKQFKDIAGRLAGKGFERVARVGIHHNPSDAHQTKGGREMKITVKQLVKLNACANQVVIFKRLFGPSATVTLANCVKAGKAGLAFDWAARNLLPATAWDAYQKARATALDAYEKETAPALDAYQKATATARDAYQKARAPAWDAYQKARAPAWDAYQKETATARDAYLKAKAPAFYRAINKGGGK